MTLVLIGSRALAIRAPHLLNRKPSDFDFIASAKSQDLWLWQHWESLGLKPFDYIYNYTTYPKPNKDVVTVGDIHVEFERAGTRMNVAPSTNQLVEYVNGDLETIKTEKFGLVPSLDVLFTLKKSHRYLKNSPHFWKTLRDYHVMKRAGCVVPKELEETLKLREKETYTYAHPSLMRDKKSFFADDSIQYRYDHDTIHQAVALGAEPAYRAFQKDGAEVQVDRAKWDRLPLEVQLSSVIEESCVLAVERSLVPHPGVLTPKKAWLLALSKVLSSITSGWWREFAYEHAFEVMARYPQDYFEKFEAGVKSGLVKEHKL